MKRYTYRQLERSDHENLSRLHQRYLGVERDNAFYEWKYWNNPCGPHGCTVAVENETGDIVGQIGSIPILFRFFGRVFRAFHEVDIVIAERPDRGRLFVATYKNRCDQIKSEDAETRLFFNYAFTIPVTLKITSKLWRVKDVAPAPKMVRILKHAAILRQKLGSSLLSGAGGLLLDGWTGLRHPIVAPRGLDVVETPAFDDSADRFWDRIKDTDEIWTERSKDYLNWRYVQPPHCHNTIFTARAGRELLGYLVIQIQTGKPCKAIIQDFQFLPDRKDAGRALLQRGLRYSAAESAAMVISWTFAHSYTFALLEEFGFVTRETTGRNLVVRNTSEIVNPHIQEPFDVALKPENWHICKGDADDE